MRLPLRYLWPSLLLLGCDQLFSGLLRDHPDNCVQDPGLCRASERCNARTELCEAMADGAVPAAAPSLSALSPEDGSIFGGAPLSLSGAGFSPGAVVTVGGQPATDVSVESSSRLTAILPRRDDGCGLSPITVKNPDGQSVTRADLFRYRREKIMLRAAPRALPFSPGRAVALDLNKDGRLDLAVLSPAQARVEVLLRRPDGGFEAGNGAATDADPQGIAAGDISGDGVPDVLVANHGAGSGNTVSVLVADGGGSFQRERLLTIDGAGPFQLALGELNGAAPLDLAVVLPSERKIVVMYSRGGGAFSPGTSFFVAGPDPRFVLLADLNGDGRADLVVPTQGAIEVRLAAGGPGEFAGMTLVRSLTGRQPASLAAADFDRDGKMDLVAADRTAGIVDLLLGRGDGTLAEPLQLGAMLAGGELGFHGIAALDLDCDAWPDIAYGFIGTRGAKPQIVVGLNQRGVQGMPFASSTLDAGLDPLGLVSGDFDGDGRADLLTASGTGAQLGLYLTTP